MCDFAVPKPFKVAIPVIDLGPCLADEPGALDRAAAELHHALTEIGFYSIVNHGVPSAPVDEVYRQVARFRARSLGEKLKIKLDKHNVGYLPMMGDTLRTSVVADVTKPNVSEAFFMARDLAADHPDVVSGRRFRSANQWPEGLPGFREPLVEYCDAVERLAQRLVRVYARALNLPATYFDGPFTDLQYKLRATHYPPWLQAPDNEFGIAPHTDTSFLTLLAPNDVPGLSSLAHQLGILGVLLLTSKGAAGVTGSGFIVLAATLSSIGTIPVASIALILGVDPFMSEARALTNLIGNGLATGRGR
jgi:isopenicillin N synthase-like dioxygenase